MCGDRMHCEQVYVQLIVVILVFQKLTLLACRTGWLVPVFMIERNPMLLHPSQGEDDKVIFMWNLTLESVTPLHKLLKLLVITGKVLLLSYCNKCESSLRSQPAANARCGLPFSYWFWFRVFDGLCMVQSSSSRNYTLAGFNQPRPISQWYDEAKPIVQWSPHFTWQRDSNTFGRDTLLGSPGVPTRRHGQLSCCVLLPPMWPTDSRGRQKNHKRRPA